MLETRASAHSLPARRLSDLVALAERRLADAFGGRIARLYAWGIAVSYGVVFAVTPAHSDDVLSRALVALAWIPGGLIALAAARDQRRLDDESGLVALVRQRGFDERELELARWLAAVRRLARVMGYPALALALVSASEARNGRDALASGLVLLGTAGFVLGASFVLATAARASAMISRERGRLTLLGLVLLPHLARALFPWMPSIPSALGELLALSIGGGS